MKVSITQPQLVALVALVRTLHQTLFDQMSAFAADPVAMLTQWCAAVGYEIEITLDPSAHVAAALADLGHAPAQTPSSAPVPLKPGSNVLPIESLPRPPAPSSAPVRRATPQEAEGYTLQLGGRKWHQGSPLRLAGPGSWFVMLEDGTEVVLPTHALSFAGAVAPEMMDAPADETLRAWIDAIAGRTGRIIGSPAPGNYTIVFPDGELLTLPAVGLQYAGCEVPA